MLKKHNFYCIVYYIYSCLEQEVNLTCQIKLITNNYFKEITKVIKLLTSLNHLFELIALILLEFHRVHRTVLKKMSAIYFINDTSNLKIKKLDVFLCDISN